MTARPKAKVASALASVAAAVAALAVASPSRAAVPLSTITAAAASATPSPGKPPRVRSTEHVDGLRVTRSPSAPFESPSHVLVTGDPAHPACIANAESPDPLLQDRIFAYPTGPSLRVREERLAVDGGRPRLETRTFWVDPKTLGARLLDQGTTELSEIARGPGALRVYAFRSGATLHVVVPEDEGRATFRDARSPGATTSCGHVHMTVTDGASALAFVSSADKTSGDKAGLGEKMAAAVVPPPDLGENEKKMIAAVVPPPAPAPPSGRRAVRKVRVAVSISQAHRDPEPIVAVTLSMAPGDAAATRGDPLAEDLAAVSSLRE